MWRLLLLIPCVVLATVLLYEKFVPESSSSSGGAPSSEKEKTTMTLRRDENEALAGCEGLDEKSCLAASCSWCAAAAVPSACHAPEDAARLPPGVFNCKTGNEVLWDEHKTAAALCDPNVKQLAGYLRLGKSKNYFFWLFESRNQPKKDPITVWLNGGPGCSSMFGLLAENGPCSVDPSGKTTKIREDSWTNNSTVVFIDQPPGTGYSYGKLDRDEKTIGLDMLTFLNELMTAHPEYSDLPLYIFGESYAGHYVPSIAYRVYEYNLEAEAKGLKKLNLKGVGIGNGLTDPYIQYQYYPQMGKEGNALSEYQYEKMKAELPVCLGLIKACNQLKLSAACTSAVNYCNSAMIGPIEMNGLNVYDYTKKCETSPPLCYDFSRLEVYMNLPNVRSALGIPDKVPRWVDCSNAPHTALISDWMLPQSDKIAILLNADIPVLIYAGDLDYICNYLGNQAWTKALKWKGSDQFNLESSQSPWKKYGLIRRSGPFTFLRLFNAGHMTPMDRPKASLEMFNDFISKRGAWGDEETQSSQ